MMNHPAVSVIVPVYNVEKYLSRCLDSVLGQSFRDIEVICVDDGSTDSSPEILRRYAAQDKRIRVITQKNQGVSVARNAGLDAAIGEWIAFVDSDDEVLPEIWESLLAAAGDEDAICFNSEEVSIENEDEPVIFGINKVKFSGVKTLEDDQLLKVSMAVWDKLFRRSKVEEAKIRFPQGIRFEDNVFVVNFFALYRKVRFIPCVFYRYFRSKNSFMHSVHHRKAGITFDCIRVLDPMYRFWLLHNLLPQKQVAFELACLNCLRAAISWCQPWERAGIAYAMAKSLHDWGMKPQTQELCALHDGTYSLYLAPYFQKEITMLKPLKGLQKILYIGNCQGRKILCIFGIKVLHLD